MISAFYGPNQACNIRSFYWFIFTFYAGEFTAFLESERCFRYDNHVNNETAPLFINNPPLIQPHSLNTLWHELFTKKGERTLKIPFVKGEDSLATNITDSILGRKNLAVF